MTSLRSTLLSIDITSFNAATAKGASVKCPVPDSSPLGTKNIGFKKSPVTLLEKTRQNNDAKKIVRKSETLF